MGKTKQFNRRDFFCSMYSLPLVGASFSAVQRSEIPAGRSRQSGKKEDLPLKYPAVPVRGIKDAEPEAAVALIEELDPGVKAVLTSDQFQG